VARVKRPKQEHKYVPLSTVLMFYSSSTAFLGLAAFTAVFIYRSILNAKNYEAGTSGHYDLFNLSFTLPSLIFVFSILILCVVVILLVIKAIYDLNHPVTLRVTIQYVDNRGNLIQVTRETDDQDEINARRKKKEPGDRFQRLSLLDKAYPKFENVVSTDGLTLEYICRRFRSFCSRIEGNPLYYSIDDIRRFVAALGVSKIAILQGMSGTGKTSLPVAWGKFTKVQTAVIPVQPMWKERSDLIGYFNEFTGKFNESMILEKLYEANKSDKIFIIVLDEVNIARVEYYFAEFLSLLELPTVEERILEVTSSISKKDPKELRGGKLLLPDNVYFIGTANNDDSTFSISDKVYDRSMIMNLDYRCDAFIGEDDHDPITISNVLFKSLIEKAKKEYSLTKRAKNHIKMFDSYIQETFSITFGNRIIRQIEAYVPIYIACGGTEIEALDDILAKKVLRKLESQNPVYVKSKSEELILKINEIFGNGRMPVCEAYIRKLSNNA